MDDEALTTKEIDAGNLAVLIVDRMMAANLIDDDDGPDNPAPNKCAAAQIVTDVLIDYFKHEDRPGVITELVEERDYYRNALQKIMQITANAALHFSETAKLDRGYCKSPTCSAPLVDGECSVGCGEAEEGKADGS